MEDARRHPPVVRQRRGVWRLLRLFEEYEVRSTFFAAAVALELNPAAGRAMVDGGRFQREAGDSVETVLAVAAEARRGMISCAVGVSACVAARGQSLPERFACRAGAASGSSGQACLGYRRRSSFRTSA